MTELFLSALFAGIGVAIVAGPLGCFVVWRRLAYFGAAVSHSALFGVVLGYLMQINMTVAVIIFCVLFSWALVALERLDDFDARGSFLAWMVQIVKYTALNERRKRQRRRTSAADPVGLDTAHTSAGRPASDGSVVSSRGMVVPGQESFDDDVLKALDALEETARACLLLRTVMDMPYKEVSLALDIPEGTAMSHVHRARKTMRDRLMAAGRDR